MEIKTSRLIITQVDEPPFSLPDDAEANNSFFHSIPKKDLHAAMDEDLNGVMRSLFAVVDSTDRRCFLAALPTGEMVLYLSVISTGDLYPELQISVLPEWRHQGYGKEALTAVLDYCFKEGTEGFLYRLRPNNEASEHLVHSLGGQLVPPENKLDGLLFKRYLILKSNWEAESHDQ